MNNRQGGVLFPILIAVLIFSAFVVISILIPYPGELWSEALHKFNHEQYQWVAEPEQQLLIEKKLEGKPVGGMQMGYPGNIRTGLQYAYTHNEAEGAYYYRFRNVGKTNFCFSSRLLPPLIGQSKLYLGAGETLYLVVHSAKAPAQSCANVHLWESCKLIHSTFAGGSCMLVPGNK